MDKIYHKGWNLRILLVISAGLIISTLVMNIIWLMLTYIIVISGIYMGYQILASDVAKLAPSHDRGVAMGALGFFMSFGRGCSTLIVGVVWNYSKINHVFLMIPVFIFLSVLINWTFSKSSRLKDELFN